MDFLYGRMFGIPIYKVIIALIIVLLFIAMQKLFYKVIGKVIHNLFIRGGVNIEDSSMQLLRMPLKLLFFVVGLAAAVGYLDLPKAAAIVIFHIIHSLFIFLLFWSGYRLMDVLKEFLHKQEQNNGQKVDDMLIPLLFKAVKVVLAIVGLALMIQEWDYNITTLLTGLGLGGLAFALAAQDTLSNFFGSVMIIADRPFRVGDWILTSGAEGVVEEIGFRSTKIRTFSEALVSIPNSVLSKEAITNWSRMGKRRVTFRLGLSYGTPPGMVKSFAQRAKELLDSNGNVSPGTVVLFDAFGEYSLEVLFYFYTNTTKWQEYLEIKEAVNLQLMVLLEEMNLSLAFPSRSIYVENSKEFRTGLENTEKH